MGLPMHEIIAAALSGGGVSWAATWLNEKSKSRAYAMGAVDQAVRVALGSVTTEVERLNKEIEKLRKENDECKYRNQQLEADVDRLNNKLDRMISDARSEQQTEDGASGFGEGAECCEPEVAAVSGRVRD